MRFLSTLIASTLGTFVALGILMLFGFLFLIAVATSADPTPRVRPGSVLQMKLGGPLQELVSGDPLNQAFGNEQKYDQHDLVSAFRKAAVDDRIDAVVIELQGVSGSWSTMQEVRRAMIKYKSTGKPLYVYTGDYMINEANYFLASAADSMFASPEALFEFNGFEITVEYYRNALDKLGVEPQIVRAGTFKSAVETYERADLSPENAQQLQALIDTINDTFVEAVSEGRGMTPRAVEQLLEDNLLLTTREGAQAGLFDALLYPDQLDDVVRARLGLDADEDVPYFSLSNYLRVSPSEAGLTTGDEGTIAVVFAEGAIMTGESSDTPNPLLGTTTLGTETFAEAMASARERSSTKAVVVRINSPGGSAPAADAMRREIERTAAVKPVIVSMSGVAASGGYWMAMAADTVVANPLTITGSIGVFTTFFDMSGLFEDKLGITYDGVRTSPYADMFSGLRAWSPAERQRLQRSTEATYNQFLSLVADSRGMSTANVDAVAQGRVWMGSKAQELGLVDVLGGLDTAIEIAAEAAGLAPGTYRTRALPLPKTFIEELTATLNARAASAWFTSARSPAEQQLLKQAEALRTLTETHGSVQARQLLSISVR